MLGSIAGILSGVGSIAGALGGGKAKGATQVSGYASLPEDVKSYMLEDLFPEIKAYQKQPYQSIPKRRLTAADYDPIFGSKSQQYLQQYKDQLAEIRAQNPGVVSSETNLSPADISNLFTKNESTGKQYLKQQPGVGVNKSTPGYFSLEDSEVMGNQGMGAGMSAIQAAMIKQMMNGMQKRAVA